VLTAKLRTGRLPGSSFDTAHMSKGWRKYNDQLGRRLPMTAFQELVLNETSGKRNEHFYRAACNADAV